MYGWAGQSQGVSGVGHVFAVSRQSSRAFVDGLCANYWLVAEQLTMRHKGDSRESTKDSELRRERWYCNSTNCEGLRSGEDLRRDNPPMVYKYQPRLARIYVGCTRRCYDESGRRIERLLSLGRLQYQSLRQRLSISLDDISWFL